MKRSELKQLIKQVIQENFAAMRNPEAFKEPYSSSPEQPPEAQIEAIKNDIRKEVQETDPDWEKVRNDIDRLEDLGEFGNNR